MGGAWSPIEACEFSVLKWAAQMRLIDIATDKDVRAGYRIAQRIAGAKAEDWGIAIKGAAKLSEGAAARPPERAGATHDRPAKKRSARFEEKKRARWEAHKAIKFGAVEAAAAEPDREDVAMETQPMLIVGEMPAPLVASLLGSATIGAMQVKASAGARPATSTLNGDAAVFVFSAGVDATSSWPSMAAATDAINAAKRRAPRSPTHSQGVLRHPAKVAASSHQPQSEGKGGGSSRELFPPWRKAGHT